MFRHPYLQIALWGVCHGLLGPEGCLKMSHFGQLRDLVLLVAKPPQNVPLIDFARKLSLEAECIMLDLAQNDSSIPNVFPFLVHLFALLATHHSAVSDNFFQFPDELHEQKISCWAKMLASLPRESNPEGYLALIASIPNKPLFYLALSQGWLIM